MLLEKLTTPSFELLEKRISSPFSLVLDQVQSFKSLICFLLSEKTKKNLLIVSGGPREDDFIETLSSFSKNILEFPSWETLPEERILPSPDIIGERFSVLQKLLKPEKKIVFAPLQSVLQKTICKDELLPLLHIWKRKSSLSFNSLPSLLTSLGYKRVSVVADKGEFAIRGGILDIFSLSAYSPYRIEFFSSEIESIRLFDPVTQKTIEKVESAFICPANELQFIEKRSSTLLEYLEDPIVIFDDLISIEDVYLSLKILSKNFNFLLSLEEFILKIKDKVFFSKESLESLGETKILKKEKGFQELIFEFADLKIPASRWSHPFMPLENFLIFESEKEELTLYDQIEELIKAKIPICFFSDNESEEIIIKKNLQEKNISTDLLSFERGYFSTSFIISELPLAIIPFAEFTHKKKLRRQKFRTTYNTPIAEYHNLEAGDLVVHFHSGIGKYLGIEKQKNHLGKEEEFLVLEYDKNAKLFVPLSQSYLVSKYIGCHYEKPILTTLGSTKWQNTKNHAQQKIVGYASDLLNLYAERSQEMSTPFPEDSEEMKLFEMEFPYEETLDQLNAINAVKQDLRSEKPMERLILGDVGYGKTEVAMRAAFKTVVDGKKQTAILVPTTVLAMQHFETFKERMEGFGISVQMVSRFNTAKKNKEILSLAKEGKIDILIGTHRLLSKDVIFKNLGLIIIDEEQRFGVRAKEHLKNIKKNIASLTLTATPIPRTLYMSLINIRDMSVISTPPQDRLPIKTIIAVNEDEIIKNGIYRELAREGQIFFIHNRVESIYKRAAHLQTLVPHLKILVVHGQMENDEIDLIFHTFKNAKADLLITTTIIENGIDIPNANTIFIDNADTFGLADLYQLRGRVGRWNRPAFAYLLVAKNKESSEIAKKRLSALLEAGNYGGGIKIALRDLEIRGAGDVLGVQQSGEVSAIGFHLYCKLLKRAIQALKNKKEINFVETRMEFSFPASIPSSYILESNLKMEIYHRLGECAANEEIDEIAKELIDRFGPLPIELNWLLTLGKIRVFANNHKIALLKFKNLSLIVQKQVGKENVEKSFILPLKVQMTPDLLYEHVIKELENSFV